MDTDDVFLFFFSLFSICVHDNKMAVKGNVMHFKAPCEMGNVIISTAS